MLRKLSSLESSLRAPSVISLCVVFVVFIAIWSYLVSLLSIFSSSNTRFTRQGALPGCSVFYLQHLEQCLAHIRHRERTGQCLHNLHRASLMSSGWVQTDLWGLLDSVGSGKGPFFRRRMGIKPPNISLYADGLVVWVKAFCRPLLRLQACLDTSREMVGKAG